MYRGFPMELLQTLACHNCSGAMNVSGKKRSDDRVVSGELRCKSCKVSYPIEDGIVNLLGSQSALDETSQQEIVSRDQEADIYDDAFCTPEGNLMEVTPTIEHLGSVSSKTILDMGCGTGRITLELIKTARSILAIDYSRGSLITLMKKCPQDARLGLVCADITQVRFAKNAFQGVVSAQVLQHLKEQSARNRMYAEIRNAMQPGSVFVLSAYHFDLKKRLLGQSREGFHSSNIFYHNFSVGEIRQELKPFFDIDQIHPIEIRIPWIHKFIKNQVRFSRLFEHVPLFNQFGDWLIAKATRSDD